jgi:hypothetical protein
VRTNKSRRGVGGVIVEEIGTALLVRMPTDPAAALVAMAAALPPEPGRIAIVSAPSITTRPDFFLVIARIIKVHVRDNGVRLVALGSTAKPSQWSPRCICWPDVSAGRSSVPSVR